MDDIELLSGVLDKTADIVSGVDDSQLAQSTPCPDYDVRTLGGHLVGWAQVFAEAAAGETPSTDPRAYAWSEASAADFRAAADKMAAGWRSGGTDRTVTLSGGQLPAAMALNMTLMEFLTHGWDLAVATGQEPGYTEAEAEETLARAQATLQPEYRGDAFGPPVAVADDAVALDRFVGFMGRTPA